MTILYLLNTKKTHIEFLFELSWTPELSLYLDII